MPPFHPFSFLERFHGKAWTLTPFAASRSFFFLFANSSARTSSTATAVSVFFFPSGSVHVAHGVQIEGCGEIVRQQSLRDRHELVHLRQSLFPAGVQVRHLPTRFSSFAFLSLPTCASSSDPRLLFFHRHGARLLHAKVRTSTCDAQHVCRALVQSTRRRRVET